MTGVNLSKKMPKGEQANGLDALAEVMKRGMDMQYVLLAVVPVEDVKPRAGGDPVINAQILAVEPLVTTEHRRLAETMLLQARRERRGHVEQELPIPE